MTTKKIFLEVCEAAKEAEKFLDDSYEIGIDLNESSLTIAYGILLDKYMESNFEEWAVDIFTDYLFEKIDEVTINGEYIIISSFSDLWDKVLSKALL